MIQIPGRSPLTTYAPLGARLLIAPIFLLSGLGKLAAPEPTIEMISAAGLPLAPVAFGLAVVVEVLGALALLAGYRTRWASLALAGFTLVAAAAFHSNFADQNQMIHFLKNVALAGGLLQIAAFGAGGLSLDARRYNRTAALTA